MLNRIKKILILTSIIFISINSLGCSDDSQSINGVKYKIMIWTDENATLYLPLPLDLPNYTVSDLTSKIEIIEKSEETQASYEVINTTHGYALKINTTGNVVLSANAGEEYFETHPDVPVHPFIPGLDEPMFFDLSLQVNPTDILDYDRWAYLETEGNSTININVFEWLDTSTNLGAEVWLSLEDNSLDYYGNFTLKPGWQIIKFTHDIGYA